MKIESEIHGEYVNSHLCIVCANDSEYKLYFEDDLRHMHYCHNCLYDLYETLKQEFENAEKPFLNAYGEYVLKFAV